jgi:hypothetical protein
MFGCSTTGGADTFDDVTINMATAMAQLTGRDLVGLTHVWAVSLEKAGRCTLTEAFPWSSCVVGVVGHRFLSCKVRFLPLSSGTDLTVQIEGQIPL